LNRDQQEWLAQFGWQHPPKVSVDARAVLPPWAGGGPGWVAAAWPALELSGGFSLGAFTFRGLPADSSESRFTYTNTVWNVPRLHVTHGDARIYMDYSQNDRTASYQFVVDSQWDPAEMRPLLPPGGQAGLDQVHFTGPPIIRLDIQGNWHDPARTAFDGHLAATNLVVRGQPFDAVDTDIEFSNSVIRVGPGRLALNHGQLTVSNVDIDISAHRVTTSNAVSTLEAESIEHALGDITPAWLLAFRFDDPPSARMNGSFVWDNPQATDLHFVVSSRNCRFTNFLADVASGSADWIGTNVYATNFQASMYGGTMAGWAIFEITEHDGAGFRGDIALTNISLSALVHGWGATSNQVEGLLSGDLVIEESNSDDTRTWRGYGNVFARDALLWDIPVFGVLSPVLNAIIPGSGNNRAYEAKADFR
ncbi:MAG: hypothetical protein ACRD5L_05115, partial [Bryobacteraceae bacterium]